MSENKREGKYLVTYTNGRTQVVEGLIQLFSTTNTSVIHSSNAVYLNTSSVLSVIPHSDGTGKEV